ncbi:bifunctional DNA primase/polymerase [Haloplanus halophilus]|uniref:bifunctional DNA primase/polymerase n=1 Tax=Haloplanus halophilus TaxID=2949993 RepID=UPI00203BB482|nr:bifunctional DNA primase/polymerase [Haloplanus sp. GDY1]
MTRDAPVAECFRCGEPATEAFGGSALCADCDAALDAGDATDAPDRPDRTPGSSEIPAPLDTLGQMFVPIEPREKGTRRPRTDEHLFAPGDPVLEAYLEAGHGYGVVCRNDLVVLDADAPERLREVIEALPDTAWQVSGSGEGEHYFLQVPGIDEDLKLYHPEDDEHLGEIKGAAQSYVVGPGSIHPSGNRYGPLQVEEIATVEEETLRDLLDPFLRESRRSQDGEPPHEADHDGTSGVTATDDVDLSAYDVLTRGRYPVGERREHPFHGSETGANFMVDDRGETFRCWRHDCTGNALHLIGIEQGIIDCGEWLPSGLDSDTWSDIFAAAREAGYDLPEFEPSESGNTSRVVECAPPADGLEPVDIDAVREQIRGPIYDGFVKRDDAPTVCAHDPGAGKTTTAHLAAADRDRPLGFLFDKHAKAHEHRAGGITPDVDLHLRGASQPREDDCARVTYEGETCDEHGDPSNCPRMCPLYDLPEGHADREAFEALAAEVGPVRAHLILEPHGGDGCAWIDEFADLEGADAVVGVHEYQRLKTVRSAGDEPRDVLVDESPGVLADDRRLTVRDLVQLANTLEGWHGRGRVGETLRRVGRFARDVADALVAGEDLGEITPPTPVADSYESHDDAAGHYMEYVEADECDDARTVEALARARRAFLDHHLGAIRDPDREWKGTPLAIDALLAAAAAAGLDEDLVRTVAGRPLDLDHCPVCASELEFGGGGRHCPACEWTEQDGALTAGDPTPARILAWIDAEPRDPAEEPALVRRRLPSVDELPTDPLVLDATATPERIAALYGAEQDDVHIAGAEQYALPGARVTQILDGQYHASTLRKAVDEDRSTARRVQARLDRAEVVYDRPLVVGRQDTPALFDLPDNARFIHFHAARGLNFEECDAVIVVGAPHPDIEDLRRKAELLAQGREDLRVGGVEHSTREDCPNPPIYRKLRYVDDEGRGRAVATKHYTGLVGALFREAREKELEQVVHRVRPLLGDPDDPVDVELLTNVPTSLPIDEVCSLEELAETPAAMLPVTDGALDLAGTLANIAAGEGPDGFRAAALVERDGDGVRFRIREVHRVARVTGHDVTERTVRRWIEDLEDLGLVDAGDYAPREGVPYSADGATLTRALEVLTNNADVEVAVKRRLAALASELDSAAEWLRRASALVDLRGGATAAGSAANRGDRPPDGAD